MRSFRRPALRRWIAALLAVAVGLTLAPSASAVSRVDAVRTVLDDDAAFDAALLAARSSEDPLLAFAEAYEAATDGAVRAEAVLRLIGGASMSGVAPVPLTDTLSRAQVAGPTSSPSPSDVSAIPRLAAAGAGSPDAGIVVPGTDGQDASRAAQPRGP